MGIIQNIKYQYRLKSLEELFKNSNFKELNISLINYCKKDPQDCLKLLKIFMKDILNITSDQKILNDNIIFVNSYDLDDGKILTDFIDFYLKKIGEKNFLISNYQDQQLYIFEKLQKSEKYYENDFFENSIFYQSLLTLLNENEIKILRNQSAFFSTHSNLNFTNTRLTKCYFLIIDHPYKAYEKYKAKYQSKDLAMNEFLNLDNLPLMIKKDELEFSIPRKSWQIFHNSWSDPNVVNTLRGAILKKEVLNTDPGEFFASIILHLRQSNFLIPLDYKLIDNYVSNFSDTFSESEFSNTLSNKEKKLLDRQIEQVSEHLDYIL